MTVITIISLLLTVAYMLLMAAYRVGWARQQAYVLPGGYVPGTFISVIIAARNERQNIGACVASVLAQQYPAHLFEVIVVDDHSDDGTAAIVDGFAAANVRCISLAESLGPGPKIVAYKKAAIAAGIAHSKGDLIVTTDADCTMPHTWLRHIASIYEEQGPLMIVAPVIFSNDGSILQSFQLIDFMSMQGITAAAHRLGLGNMSNGANLAFSRAAYEGVGGYDGIDHMASGDDYLLMVKMSATGPGKIAYLKSVQAIVATAPQLSWRGFLQQRIRWASKSGKYNDARLTGILMLVYLFNVSFLVVAIAGIFHPVLFCLAGGMLVAKMIIEYSFLLPVARFFGKKAVLGFLFLLQPLHIAYIIIAGFLGFVGGYEWKGRQVK